MTSAAELDFQPPTTISPPRSFSNLGGKPCIHLLAGFL